MFEKTDILAFLMRCIIFILVWSSFTILNHFFRVGLIKLFIKVDGETVQMKDWLFYLITAVILLFPANVSIFYPHIADVLGYAGTICGIFVIFILPIVTYLYKLKMECDNPLMA